LDSDVDDDVFSVDLAFSLSRERICTGGAAAETKASAVSLPFPETARPRPTPKTALLTFHLQILDLRRLGH